MNENQLIQARLTELAQRAFERGYTTVSDFLNMHEISLLKTSRLAASYTLYGGYEGAERCLAAFGDAVDTAALPIVCIAITPVQQKFADALTHRDVLGALMHLGIERSTLGDILLHQNTAYLFCLQTIAPYILQNLTRIKHTTVSCCIIDALPPLLTEQPPVTELAVASLRADAVVGAAFRLSRSETSKLFDAEKVFINAVTAKKESTLLKDGDTLSVRGKGKLTVEGIVRQTKKSRLILAVRLYR